MGIPDEDVGAIRDAGAVNVLYGASGGLTATGSQQFWQGAGGVAGTAEAFDNFGWTVSAGDFNNNGFADLAIGVPFEAIGAIEGAGAGDGARRIARRGPCADRLAAYGIR